MKKYEGVCDNFFTFGSNYKNCIMGKGDQRSKKGKIHIGTFGRLRPRKKAAAKKAAAAKKEAPKKAAKKAAK